jgi:hypothetical protein
VPSSGECRPVSAPCSDGKYAEFQSRRLPHNLSGSAGASLSRQNQRQIHDRTMLRPIGRDSESLHILGASAEGGTRAAPTRTKTHENKLDWASRWCSDSCGGRDHLLASISPLRTQSRRLYCDRLACVRYPIICVRAPHFSNRAASRGAHAAIAARVSRQSMRAGSHPRGNRQDSPAGRKMALALITRSWRGMESVAVLAPVKTRVYLP